MFGQAVLISHCVHYVMNVHAYKYSACLTYPGTVCNISNSGSYTYSGLLSACVWQALLEGWYHLSQSVGIPLREWLLLMCGVRIPFGNCSRQFSSGFMLQILDHHGILHAQPMNPIDTAKELLETAIHTNLESRPSFRAVILSCLRAVIWRLGEKYRFSIWDPSSIPWEYNTKQRGDLQLAAVPWFRVLNKSVSGVCRVNIVFFPDVPM